MADAMSRDNEGLRRKSMLPQLTQKGETQLPLASPTRLKTTPQGEDSHTGQNKAVTVDTKSQGTDAAEKGPKTSMPPPTKLGRLPSSQAPPRKREGNRPSFPGSLRNSSTIKAPILNDLPTAARPRTSSGTKLPATAARATSHGRSFSSQVKSTYVRDANKMPCSTTTMRSSSIELQKPAFSALQQHYSPAKGPRRLPPVPSIRSLQETNREDTVDNVLLLQSELAQLHLMHRSAPRVQCQWAESARSHFQRRFDDLSTRNMELKEIAHEQQTLLNQFSLVEWGQGIPSSQVAEKVQTLSRSIADLDALLEPSGKYTKVLEVFETWFKQAQRTHSLRKSADEDTQRKDLAFIEGIGDGWKAEAMVLERELTYCSRDVKAFGDVRLDSSLGILLNVLKTLVANLLKELDVVQWIESQTMVQEAAWMENAIQKLSSDIAQGIGI
ncbi:MAG: hypothetical protein Q9217_004604 [Psora testacea]